MQFNHISSLEGLKWTPRPGIHYGEFYLETKVGNFPAIVWKSHQDMKWKFRFAGESDLVGYDTKEIAQAACEIRLTSWLVSACAALGYRIQL